MAIDITIPEVGESISEVQIGEWRKSEGDTVEQDEILVEIETEKASMEVPAPGSGTLSRIAKQSGDTAEIGEVIGQIESNGERNKRGASEDTERTASTNDKPKRRESEGRPEEESDEKHPTPLAIDGKPQPHQESNETEELDEQSSSEELEATPRAAPLAKRDPRMYGPSTSESGEMDSQRGDARMEDRPVLRQPISRKARSRAEAGEMDGREEETVPMSRLRQSMARRLVEAQHTAALLTTFNEIDMSAVLDLRKRFGESFRTQFEIGLGLMSFFVKASIEALKRVPVVNGEIRGNEIVYRNYFDVGVAIATDHGLVVPVLRDADVLSFADIEKAIADFASRAREKKLMPNELEGGTFTISNGGVYGSLLSTPIVNPPQSGILGLHAIQDRAVACNGQVVIRPMMYVALSYDHRLIDGREAVTFLNYVKQFVEDPARMLLEL